MDFLFALVLPSTSEPGNGTELKLYMSINKLEEVLKMRKQLLRYRLFFEVIIRKYKKWFSTTSLDALVKLEKLLSEKSFLNS